MSGNPFYIQPVDVSSQLAGLGKVLGDVQERKQKQQRMDEYRSLAEKASTPDDYMALAIQYPEHANAMKLMMDVDAKNRGLAREEMGDVYRTAYLSPDPAAYLEEWIANNPDKPLDAWLPDLGMALENPEQFRQMVGIGWASIDPDGWKALQDQQKKGESSVAAIQEMQSLTKGMSDEDIERARRIKLGLDPRASTAAETAASVEFAKQTAALQAQLGLKPQVAAATVAAENEAKVLADEAQAEKSNTKAWSVYDSAMSNLAKAMGQTSTGVFSGFLPAVTSNQQIAEGAIAVMAPVLKDMFRSAGEGTFTDADQRMLIKMIPTRSDSPEARIEKIRAIDEIVRAKLGMGETTQPVSASSGQADTPVVTTQEQYDALPSGSAFIEDGVRRRKP